MKWLLLFCSLAVALLSQGEANVSKDTSKLALKETVEIDGRTYFFDTGFAWWIYGDEQCKAMAMRLVTFETEEKWNSIMQFIDENPAFNIWRYWTGGVSPQYTSEFYWSGTTRFNFTAWNPGQPDRDAVYETYVSMHVGTRGWDDDDGSEYYCGFICEFA